jgi:hypothetical protein
MVSNTKSMSRNLSIIGISILVLFIAIIIAAIVVTKSFRPPTDIATEDRVKTTKVGMIYQTKKGGDEWFMDPNKLKEDKRFDTNANLTKNQDGSWSVDSKEHSRLDVCSGIVAVTVAMTNPFACVFML